MPIYKDEEVEILSKSEELWGRVRKNASERLKMAQENVIVETAVIEMAERKMQEGGK